MPSRSFPGAKNLAHEDSMTDPIPEPLGRRTIPQRVSWSEVFSRRGRVYSRLKGILGLLAVVVIALLASPHSPRGGLVFLEPGNITDILRQVSEIGILSLGMTFVILIAGIDLSVGTVLAFASSLVALMLTRVPFGLPQFLAIALAMAAALLGSGLVGLANGLIVARWKIQPFVVTLATMIGIRGLARWLTSNTNIDIGFGTDRASVFASSLFDEDGRDRLLRRAGYCIRCLALKNRFRSLRQGCGRQRNRGPICRPSDYPDENPGLHHGGITGRLLGYSARCAESPG